MEPLTALIPRTHTRRHWDSHSRSNQAGGVALVPQALVSELAEVRAGAAAEREAVTGQVLAALDLLMSHKAYIQETLARVHGIANTMVRDLQPEAA